MEEKKMKENVKSNKSNFSKDIVKLIQILGIGLPGSEKINYDNSQFHKIIMSDNDVLEHN
jgi:DNA gyrase/topoisomerase IV subunit B